MIKLIASDLDGTLLNKEHKLDERTARAIRMLGERGIEFVTNTGRGIAETDYVLSPFGVCCAQILTNGAYGRRKDGTVFASICMDPDAVLSIVRQASAVNECVFFFTTGRDMIVGTPKQIEAFVFMEMHMFHVTGTPDELRAHPLYHKMMTSAEQRTVQQIEAEPVDHALKAFMYLPDMKKRDRLDEILSGIPSIVSASSAPETIELTHRDAQKGKTLLKYARQQKIAPEEILVMGDSMNDRSMLAGPFGVRVLMENGLPALRDLATHLAPDNGQFGAAHILEAVLADRLDDYRLPKD